MKRTIGVVYTILASSSAFVAHSEEVDGKPGKICDEVMFGNNLRLYKKSPLLSTERCYVAVADVGVSVG